MGGIGQLGLSVPSLLAQLINFGILFGAMYLFAYKPILKMLDKRSETVKQSLAQAEALKAKAAGAEDDIKKQLEQASKEGQERIARATRIGEELKVKAQEEARQQAETLISRARNEIQRERDEAIGQLRGAFAELTTLAAGKVIERTLDKEAHRQLIDKVLEESSTLKKG